MLETKTKYGVLTIQEGFKNGTYNLLDSDKKILFEGVDFSFIYDNISLLNQYDNISDWLEEFDDVCWGGIRDCLDYAKDYAESNGRVFDKKWAREQLNRIGDTYILFQYSEAYHDYDSLFYSIDETIKDLPRHEDLADKIVRYVIDRKWNYNKAQIQQIVDEFYDNEPTGWGVADDLFSEGIS